MSDEKFPSPLGDCVFNLVLALTHAMQETKEFPSPLGDCVFNPRIKTILIKFMGFVSVPSRGLCFQSINRDSFMGAMKAVSVPSRGLCFQSVVRCASKSIVSGFVSVPSRGLCFQSEKYHVDDDGVWRFPSPLGDCVFNLLLNLLYDIPQEKVSVPSRGLCFQSTI